MRERFLLFRVLLLRMVLHIVCMAVAHTSSLARQQPLVCHVVQSVLSDRRALSSKGGKVTQTPTRMICWVCVQCYLQHVYPLQSYQARNRSFAVSHGRATSALYSAHPVPYCTIILYNTVYFHCLASSQFFGAWADLFMCTSRPYVWSWYGANTLKSCDSYSSGVRMVDCGHLEIM